MMQTYTHYKDSGIDWIGKIPEHWEQVPNKFIFNLKKNQVGKRSSEYDLLSLTLRGIIKRDMENPEGKFPAEFDSYQEVKINDFVFCLFDVEETPRTVGLSNYDGMITGAYTVMEPIGNNFAPFLYYYYLNADDKKQLKFLYRGLRNTIPKDSFFSLKTAIPPIQEQEAIANFLDEKTAKIDALVQTKEQQIEKLKELRQAKIHQAVTKGLETNVATKNSGIEWIGEIPAHWEICKNKFINKLYNGDSLNENQKKKYESDDLKGFPYISSKDINLDFSTINYINGLRISDTQNFKVAPENTSLICIEGGSAGRKIAFTSQNVCFVNKLACFKTYKNYHSKFIYYSLNGQLFKNQFKNAMTGLIGGVSISALKNFIFTIPPIQEQEQIVAYLDEVIGKIDQAIAQKQEQITKLKEYKQSLINDVVTGKVRVG